MGDWDRHRKQWRWAKLPGNPLWMPIPEDRDQAFSRYDGLLLDDGARARPALPGLRAEVRRASAASPSTARSRTGGCSCSSRARTSWRRRRSSRRSSPTRRSTGRRALMPPEWYAIDGARLVRGPQRAATRWPDGGREVPPAPRGRVDVYLTNKTERIEAARRPNGDTEVTVRVARARTASRDRRPSTACSTRGRRTRSASTRYDGNDTVTVTGGHQGPSVRMIGGNGDDTLDATRRRQRQALRLGGPEPRDRGGRDDRGPTTPPPPAEERALDPATRLDARDLRNAAGSSYNGDLGRLPRLRRSRRSASASARARSRARTASAPAGPSTRRAGSVDYAGDFHRENRRSYFGLLRLRLGGRGAALLRLRQRDRGPGRDQDFYKVTRRSTSSTRPSTCPSASRGSSRSAPRSSTPQNDEDQDQFINTGEAVRRRRLRRARRARRSSPGTAATAPVFPRRGVFAAVRGTYFPEAWDVESDFGQVNGNVNAYLSAGRRRDARAARRRQEGVRHVPVHGGGRDRRGRPRRGRARRARGHGARLPRPALPRRRVGVGQRGPAPAGLARHPRPARAPGASTASATSAASGSKGESSDTWHTGVGGGIWLSLLNDRMAFSVGLAHSTRGRHRLLQRRLQLLTMGRQSRRRRCECYWLSRWPLATPVLSAADSPAPGTACPGRGRKPRADAARPGRRRDLRGPARRPRSPFAAARKTAGARYGACPRTSAAAPWACGTRTTSCRSWSAAWPPGSATFLDDNVRNAVDENQLGWGSTFETGGGPVYSTIFVAGCSRPGASRTPRSGR